MDNKKSLKTRIYEILSDCRPHRSDEITNKLFGTADTARTGLFRLGARIFDIRAEGYIIHSWKDKDNHKLHWYLLEGRMEDTAFTSLHIEEAEKKQAQMFPTFRRA